jgi:hypothetical protein
MGEIALCCLEQSSAQSKGFVVKRLRTNKIQSKIEKRVFIQNIKELADHFLT